MFKNTAVYVIRNNRGQYFRNYNSHSNLTSDKSEATTFTKEAAQHKIGSVPALSGFKVVKS